MTTGESSDAPSQRRDDSSMLANFVFGHVAMLVVFTSWAFGGQAPWARQVIAVWGIPGALLFVLACRSARVPGGERRHPAVRWLWPLLAYDLLVGLSGLNPSFIELRQADQGSLIMTQPLAWLPSSARPWLTWRELWQFNVFVLACFNFFLVAKTRRLLRRMLFVMGANAVGLAVLGTFQKLSGANALWLGAVPSPNPKFFSTFIYHNHWGAFTVLNLAVCLGLLFHFLRRRDQRDFWHSPVPFGCLAILLLAATVPLSASRSCTVLAGLLLAAAVVHALFRLVRDRRAARKPVAWPVAGIVAAVFLAVAAVYYVGQEVIAQRAALTSEQLASIAREDTLNSRLALYRDTLRMAAEKPWFGWGLESYAHVFRIFNTQRAAETWVWIPFYAEAHNDWLQSLAEVGFVGTGLLALLVLLPTVAVRWRRVDSILPRYLLAGVGIVLLYAWVEFPFANPAVMLTCWLTFYCAIRYATLSEATAPDASK